MVSVEQINMGTSLVLVHILSFISQFDAAKSWMLQAEMKKAFDDMQHSFYNNPDVKETGEAMLRNITLKVVVHEMIPYTLFTQEGDKTHLTGYIGEMWKVIENQLQFRSEYRKTTFWRGKEILAAGSADVMLSPVIFEPHDLQDFEIGGPVATSVYSLYFKAPDDLGSSSSYLWTWSRSLWISYLGVLALCTLLLYSMTNIRRWFGLDSESSEDHSIISRKTDCKVRLSLGNCILVILGAATQQDVQIRTKVCSLRALLLVLLMFNHLMMTSYTSVLVSRLTVGNSHTYFTSLEDIPEMESVYLSMRTNSAVISMFKVNGSSKDLLPRWKKVINKGPCHPDPRSTQHVASNICKDQCLIFESDNIMSRLLASERNCIMLRLRPKKVFSQISILFKKHFAYTKTLRNEILKMKNTGVLDLLEKRFLFEKDKSLGPQKYQEVTIGHVKALVMVYAASTLLACVILAVELTVGRFRQQRSEEPT